MIGFFLGFGFDFPFLDETVFFTIVPPRGGEYRAAPSGVAGLAGGSSPPERSGKGPRRSAAAA